MGILEPRGAAPHAVMSAQGVMVAPDGSAQRVRVKGGSLFEALHGIGEAFRRRIGRDLGTSKTDLGAGIHKRGVDESLHQAAGRCAGGCAAGAAVLELASQFVFAAHIQRFFA